MNEEAHMTDIRANIIKAASLIEGIDLRSVEIGPVVLESGAIHKVVPFLIDRSFGKVSIVADTLTYKVAGQVLNESIEQAGIPVQVTLIKPDRQGDVIADEAALIQLIMNLKAFSAEAVIAVGSGTLHDIARFSAYSVGIPFLSVPTAPSVDGFNSKGAPIIVHGEKITVQAIGPAAIFADLDILMKAPTALVAAGFGDMLGKYTSLFDWKFGSLVGGEPYSPVVAEMTRNALRQCVDHSEEIGKRSPEGIRILTAALLESGFAMLLFGQSHPASGAEHHVSHYWEMEFLRQGRRQILHGAKVGVACAEISRYYRQIVNEALPFAAVDHRVTILEEIERIPNEQTIRRLLKSVGGPSTITELDVNPDLLLRSLNEAHRIRPNRYTLLRAYNEASSVF
jgi:glycerol-1-phosphate dehydrogenase [NAD(P)+]